MILDIINYWITVSFISISLLLWLLWPIRWALNSYCNEVFPDGSVEWGEDILKWESGYYSRVIIFNKYNMSEDVAVIPSIISFIVMIALVGNSSQASIDPLITVHNLSVVSAPFLGNILLAIIGYRAFIKGSKVVVSVSNKIKNIEERLKND